MSSESISSGSMSSRSRFLDPWSFLSSLSLISSQEFSWDEPRVPITDSWPGAASRQRYGSVTVDRRDVWSSPPLPLRQYTNPHTRSAMSLRASGLNREHAKSAMDWKATKRRLVLYTTILVAKLAE